MTPGGQSPPARPLVSVIIPVKDTPPSLLFRAVASVLGQDCDVPAEVVVWDDGTTERYSSAAIDTLASQPDDRIVVGGSAENEGISAARNHACALARGQWFLWLDSDDELPPRAVRSLLAAAEEQTLFVIGQCEVHLPDATRRLHRNDQFVAKWRRADGDINDPLLNTVFAVHGGLVHRELFEHVGGFDENLRYAELTDWFLRTMASVWPHEVTLVSTPTYRYFKRTDSHSADRAALDRDRRIALHRYAAAFGWESELGTGSETRCLESGARRYDLVDSTGTVRVRADVPFAADDDTISFEAVPTGSGTSRDPAHRRRTRRNVHRVLVREA